MMDETVRPSLLDSLSLPEDLRSLDGEAMRRLATEIRHEIILTVSRTGGHLGASLGVVELTLALHAELRSPVDKIVWDVGHQCYAHKLVTGRRERFSTIRTAGGLSGFPKPGESPHDAFATGHSSTSISVGMGLAEGLRAQGMPGRVVAVIGDGALTGGMAYEGLNQAGHLATPLVVVLNDNAMSIRRNVGAMSSYLSRLRTTPALYRLRRDLERRVQRVPGIGGQLFAMGEQLKEGVKAALVPGMIFEELGFTYIGLSDGHDVEALRRDLRRALAIGGPVLLHVRTIKGKGYGPAEREPDRFHGVSAFDPGTGKARGSSGRSPDKGRHRPAPGIRTPALEPPAGALAAGEPAAAAPGEAPTYTEVFGRALLELARLDSRVVGITAAMASGTGLDLLEAALPERFFDVGIAEGHAVGFAAGLAAAGRRPVVALYSTFLQRAYDQLIHDVCLPELPVVLAIDRAGLVGEDGPTHHGAFDLSFLRLVPNLTILVPADEAELQSLLATALALERPVALRYPRGRGLGVPLPSPIVPVACEWVHVERTGRTARGDEPVESAGRTARSGEPVERTGRTPCGDVLLLACGTGVKVARETAHLLENEPLSCTVANVRRIRPLDQVALLDLVRAHELVVTLEENSLAGGFGSSILELMADAGISRRSLRVGLPDRFVGQGSIAALHREVGFDADEVCRRIREALDRARTR